MRSPGFNPRPRRGSADSRWSSASAQLIRSNTTQPSALGQQAVLYATGTGPPSARLPTLPPEDQVYDASFFRRLFDRADKLGYTRGADGIHVATFHQFCRRMSDSVGSEEILFDPHQVFSPSRMPFRKSPYVSWTDMRHALEDVDEFGCPVLDIRVKLNLFERINMGFSGNGASLFGSFWATSMFILIMFTCIHIMTEELQGQGLSTGVVLLFTADYVVKLCCSPFVRFAVSHPDHLISITVPDPADVGIQPRKATFERVISFVTSPMNVLDIASVAPYWINLLLVHFPFNLGFLRALRILRAAHALRIGAFSDMLAILGETLRGSAGALLVTVVWTVIISVMVGPVLQQIAEKQGKGENGEPAPWSFDSVSASVIWVIGRLCNMHGSVQEKHHIPRQDIATLAVLFLGICKGCVLLVPVGQIAAAFKSANDDFEKSKQSQEQVSREKLAFLGTEWNRDPLAPSVRLELLDAVDDSEAGIASFNVPILETREVNSTVIVPINSKSMQGLFWRANPTVRIRIHWKPTAQFSEDKLRSKMRDNVLRKSTSMASAPPRLKRKPTGILSIVLDTGQGFHGAAGARWKCRVQVPVRLSGAGSLQELTTEPSMGEAPHPYWVNASEDFEIDWSDTTMPVTTGRSAIMAPCVVRVPTMKRWIDRFLESEDLSFEWQVFEILSQRERCIEQLQRALEDQAPASPKQGDQALASPKRGLKGVYLRMTKRGSPGSPSPSRGRLPSQVSPGSSTSSPRPG